MKQNYNDVETSNMEKLTIPFIDLRKLDLVAELRNLNIHRTNQFYG